MSAGGKTIAKNMGVMMITQIITWVLSFIIAIFLPRYLGPADLGEISLANSIWMIMGVLITFGMDLHLTKSVARDPTQTPDLLGTSLVIRTLFFFVACVLVGIYLYVLKFSMKTVYVSLIVGLGALLGVYSTGLTAIVVGLERMGITSLSTIVRQALLVGLTLLLIFLNAGLYPITAINIVTNFVALGLMVYLLNRQYRLHLRVNFSAMRSMLQASAPYLVTALALVVYQQIDRLFIAGMVDTRTVGWYSTAMNLFGTTMFVPVVIGTVLLPILSRTYASSPQQLQDITRRSFDLMFLISMPVGLGTVIIANPLILLLYGPEFAQSGPILAVLGVVMIFTYLNTLLGQLLISTDRTHKWNLVMIGGILLTVPLDLVLVPWTRDTFGNGALGGTIAFLFTEFEMVVGAVLLLPKGTLQWSNVRTASLALLAGVAMLGAGWWLRETMLPLAILVSAVTYIGLVFLLRIVPKQDLLLLRDMVLQILKRVRRTP